MKTKIPSPVLARIQLMFQSGSTLDEVAAALDLDTTWEQPATASIPQQLAQPVSQPSVSQPANDTRLPRLDELTKHMEAHVSSLLERDDVRDIPALSGSLDAIYQHVTAIRKEIDSPAQNPTAAAHVAKKAKAKVVSKNAAIEGPKPAVEKAAPPPMKVQPPAKKKSQEKLKPTGELPTAGKRRDVVHPFAASLSGEKTAIQTKAEPAQKQPRLQPSTPSQPMDAYRDRIATAMNQITTIADEHKRDEDYIAVRHS